MPKYTIIVFICHAAALYYITQQLKKLYSYCKKRYNLTENHLKKIKNKVIALSKLLERKNYKIHRIKSGDLTKSKDKRKLFKIILN